MSSLSLLLLLKLVSQEMVFRVSRCVIIHPTHRSVELMPSESSLSRIIRLLILVTFWSVSSWYVFRDLGYLRKLPVHIEK